MFECGGGRRRPWPVRFGERSCVARAHAVAETARRHSAFRQTRICEGRRGDARTTIRLLCLRLRRRLCVCRCRLRGRLSFGVMRLCMFGVRVVLRRRVSLRLVMKLRFGLGFRFGLMRSMLVVPVRRGRAAVVLNLLPVCRRVVRFAVSRQLDVAGDGGTLARRVCRLADAARHRAFGRRRRRERSRRQAARQQREQEHHSHDDTTRGVKRSGLRLLCVVPRESQDVPLRVAGKN